MNKKKKKMINKKSRSNNKTIKNNQNNNNPNPNSRTSSLAATTNNNNQTKSKTSGYQTKTNKRTWTSSHPYNKTIEHTEYNKSTQQALSTSYKQSTRSY